jgi:hemerythrin superfamily protein
MPELDGAIELLKADHREVEHLFQQYAKADDNDAKDDLVQAICRELSIHTMIEEEIFYPRVQGLVRIDTVDEAYVEHDGAKLLIAELLEGSPDDDFYDAKVKVLSEEIKHHVKEEEQAGGLFDQVRKADVDLAALGEEMAARKVELNAQFEEDGVPPPTYRSMKGAKVKLGEPVG